MSESGKRPAFSSISAQSLDMFDTEDDATTEDSSTEAAQESEQPPVICQWCMATAPAGSTQCPACGGSIADRPAEPATLPGRNDFDLMSHFLTDENPRLRMVENYIHQRVGMMPLSDRRAAYRDYFENALEHAEETQRDPDAHLNLPPRLCRWCNTPAGDADERCPNCGTRLPTPPPALVAQHERTQTPVGIQTGRQCQWCQASVEPEMTTCPTCGGTLASPERHIPGLTDLTPVERAAEAAFQQAPPLHHPMLGPDPREREAAQRARELLRGGDG